MINIIVRKSSPRLIYSFEIIFRSLLDTGYRVYEKKIFDLKKDSLDNTPHINYSGEPVENAINIPNSGLLEEEKVRDFEPPVKVENDVTKLFWDESASKDAGLDFDVFSAVFWLLTEYEKYGLEELDNHRRYKEESLLIVKENLYAKPWVNIYAILLRKTLNEKFNLGLVEERLFDFRLTVDVDMPWAYLNKGVKSWMGLLKDAFRWNWKNFRNRFKALKSGQDPFFNFPYLFRKCPVEKTLFFFLIDGLTKYDKFYDYRNKHYRRLISDVMEKGYKIGLHPSYISFNNSRITSFEKKKLEEITGKTIVRSRQHFLKYRLPDTFDNLINAGIIHDYTSVMVNYPGFKYCIALPFKWFDLEQNRMTRLTIHPTMVMDATLKEHLKLIPGSAVSLIKKLIDETEVVAGRFVLLWHNSSLQDEFGWSGWRNVFEESLSYLESKSN